MTLSRRTLIFALFFASGFCGLLYQVIWLRKAFAHFGVITPVISLVISLFMLGLALGSWLGGRYVAWLAPRTKCNPIFFYGAVEFFIGIGGLLVPRLMAWGASHLIGFGESDSAQYLVASAAVLSISILPWCVCMGATFPFAMAYVRRLPGDYQSSFSYLYLANILGAVAGVCTTGAFLIEVFGFSLSLKLAAIVNAAIACTSFVLGATADGLARDTEDENGRCSHEPTLLQQGSPGLFVQTTLFATGFCSMGMEVVWTRAFTPITTTTVYAFVLLLATYLVATGEGLLVYRRHLSQGETKSFEKLLAFLAVTSYLPLLLTDPRISPSVPNVIIGLFPCCAVLGYLTPLLIDQYSAGVPKSAGRLYAINILGCILGPLFAGYILLPAVGAKWALLLLPIPFTILFLLRIGRLSIAQVWRRAWVASLVLLVLLSLLSRTHEDSEAGPGSLLLRDYTATVIAKGSGMSKSLEVNGVHTTSLTPITKVMAHLPLASLQHSPQSVLIICLGMGTTYRSALNWDINVTAVELVPSVKRALGYFAPNAPVHVSRGIGRVIIDDGRRYLLRTTEKYDVITLDPPPPVEAAASSLLYSEEFYRLARTHLRDGGILQQWIPGGSEDEIVYAVAGALTNSFPYVRVFRSLTGWGCHFLASLTPIETPTASQMIAKMPQDARQDLMEWFPDRAIERVVAQVLAAEVRLKDVSDKTGRLSITDDRPFNEYFALRRNLSLLKSFSRTR